MKNFEKRGKNKLTGAALARAIETACDGLIYISETDSTVRLVFTDKRDAENLEDAILMLAGEKTSEISESSADAFFSRLILDREWHGEIEKGRVRRFRILKDLLYTNLADLGQYRLGKTRITIYVIGLDVAGNITGIQTEAVET